MLGFGKYRLKKTIEHGIAEGNLELRIRELGEIKISSVIDAEAVCWGLEKFGEEDPETLVKEIEPLARLFLRAADDQPDTLEILHKRGLIELFRLYDRISASKSWAATNCLLLMLRVFATYNSEAGTHKIVSAARLPLAPEDYQWMPILQIFSVGHHFRKKLFTELTHPLPTGFIAVALLDTANSAAVVGKPFNHPFDYPEGVDRLRAWIRDLDPAHFSYAHSAAQALPFIYEPARSELLQLAMDHPDAGVSIKAAWAAVKIGQERGIAVLVRFARDVRYSVNACWHLDDLNRDEAIPAETRDPNFTALAEMAHWLGHPNEFGEPPDAVEIADTREMFWPPTNDRRRMWVVKYRYAPNDRRVKEDVGFGLVGSTTFALFLDEKAGTDPLDTYALHVCWEMQTHKDARAPKEISVEEGRKILAKHNP